VAQDAKQRRLAAIMFTDMVGFSRLTERNERLALELLEEHNHILRAIFASHGGIEIKTMGDGFYLEFPSALEAVQCAIDIQEALHSRNATQDVERQILIRVGIHLGDVETRGGDLYGQAVNIAARIEPLAEPGGVCVTREIYEQARHALPQTFVRLGAAELKNIGDAVDVYKVVLPWTEGRAMLSGRLRLLARSRGWRSAAVLALVLVGVGIWQETRHFFAPVDDTPSGAAVKTIAVLPFRLIGTQLAAEEYFGVGLADSLITNLSNVHQIVVRPTSAVLKYDSPMQDSLAAGREQKVDALLEATFRSPASTSGWACN
jgi:adenylate cyclase